MMAVLQNQEVQKSNFIDDGNISFYEKVEKFIDTLQHSSLTNQEILDITNKFKREYLADFSKSQKTHVIDFIDMMVEISLKKRRSLHFNGEIPQEMI